MMFDIEIPAPQGADSLARIGKCLGEAGVGLEGGGMWSGVAHYLVANADKATRALTAAGLGPVVGRKVMIAQLEADVPGALGLMMNKLAKAGITLLGQYSDHDNRKVLIVEDIEAAEIALRTATLA
ncbi:hypothetical protein QK292_17885 [Arthrobacter sp. AL08]|uniref:hypothetical protein n=1 Tax=unclassified Arthrobacter TaxID=235627 RepID=UPI00249B0405|nr:MULTISPECIES: hypothetical protein [unclassified Arthrobacter]MDI3243425.1 hypothetical protein [Arthrobacter sp. AL05]MDI3279423.1 hypothetical protein [Arthrobacter sp. AL08]